MTKVSELESEFTQYCAATDDRLGQVDSRLDKVDSALEALRKEADLRHAELLKLLMPKPPAATNPPPLRPPLHSQQPSFTSPLSAPLPIAPLSTTAVTAPHLAFSSNLLFDENGLPISNAEQTTPLHEIPTSAPGTYRFSVYHDGAESRPEQSVLGFRSMGPDQFGPTGDRPWIPGGDYRLRNLKMPLFEGEDVYGWVYRAERFFEVQGLTASGERLRAAALCLEGPALSWFRWSDRRVPFRTWDHLKTAMLKRFQVSQDGSLSEQFLDIRQVGSARDYVTAFETIAAQLDGIPENILEGTFLKGLKPALRASIRVLQPAGLGQAMQLALMIDESRGGTQVEPPRQFPKSAPTGVPPIPPTVATRTPSEEPKRDGGRVIGGDNR